MPFFQPAGWEKLASSSISVASFTPFDLTFGLRDELWMQLFILQGASQDWSMRFNGDTALRYNWQISKTEPLGTRQVGGDDVCGLTDIGSIGGLGNPRLWWNIFFANRQIVTGATILQYSGLCNQGADFGSVPSLETALVGGYDSVANLSITRIEILATPGLPQSSAGLGYINIMGRNL